MPGAVTTDQIAVTVHGAFGALDLVVPVDAAAADVAREYAAQCRLPQPPELVTAAGKVLDQRASLVSARLESGDVLVASFGPAPTPGAATTGVPRVVSAGSGAAATAWCAVAAVCAVLAGVLATGVGDAAARTSVLALLLGAGVLGVAPAGRYAAERAAVAPAFAGAAAFVLAWRPGELHLPLTVGIAGLGAAVAAAAARASAAGPRETQDVWIASGLLSFLVPAAVLLAGFDAAVAWSVLLVLALLAVRFVPGFAVDVPDQMLLDLERLAITAWSARDRARGRRGRMVIAAPGMTALLARGSAVVNAAAVAVLVTVLVSVPMLLRTTDGLLVDHIGAQVLVFLTGGAVLLAARSYRHAFARGALRLAGVYAWVLLAGTMLVGEAEDHRWYVVGGALALASVTVVSALATGRGWRSVWWARRAEIAEALCVAFALGALVVASGLFRFIWEIRS